LKTFLVTVLAYTIGSIPFGYLIVKAKAGTDIRTTGSGGTGATNVSRRAGKTAGLLTLLLDAAKGAVAVVLARMLLAQDGRLNWPFALSVLAVIVGHIFPLWLGFRGGKGVATAVGAFLVLEPLAVALCGVLFLAIVLLTRYISLASMLAALALPMFIWAEIKVKRSPDSESLLLFSSAAAALLILFAHRSNIERLLRGTESKFR
jgi:glycerol-3-phosphate acyltransferase PlsY